MRLHEKERISIFFSVDDAYVPYLTVAIRSLTDNASDEFGYDIYILTQGVSEDNRELVLGLSSENTNIEFVRIGGDAGRVCKGLSLRDYYSAATYFRMLIPELFPTLKRGIYLDCDVVVTGDISELYLADMGDALIGAVPDEVVTGNEIFSRYVKTVICVEPGEYFNAGVLVMNLERMREVGFASQFDKLRSKRTFPVAQDQDYLNVLCHGKVKFIDTEWNKTPFCQVPDHPPKLIHFKLDLRPWHYDGVPYGEEFWKYADKTPFAEFLHNEKETYTDAKREADKRQGEGLLALAEAETEKAKIEKGDDRKYGKIAGKA